MQLLLCVFVFFFKQKTAYDMRISDWSSDVCSSDLFSQGVSPCIVAHPLSPRATTAAIITRFIIASLLLLEFTIRPALGQTGERFDSFDLLTQLIHNRDRSLGNLIHSQLARDSIRGIQPNQLANLANKPKPTCCIIRNQSTP